MQPFSPDQNPAEAWQNFITTFGVWRLVALVVGWIALGIAANWIGSLCVASERATIGRAALSWLLVTVLAMVLSIVFVLLTPVARASGNAGTLSMIVAYFCGIIATVFGVPMKIYQIGILRGVGFVVLSSILSVAMQTGLQFALLGTMPFDRDQWKQVSALVPSQAEEVEPAEIEAIRAELQKRQADLARRHGALEIRRKYLPPGSSSARQAYDQEREAYERDLEQLRQDTAAALPSP